MTGGTLEQLRVSYEDLGMSLSEIERDFPQFSIESIKAGLTSCSSKYRNDCKSEVKTQEQIDAESLNFSDDELRLANKTIVELALGSEDDHLRLKAATYIRDDKKGRKEVAALIRSQNTFNIFAFNEQMQKTRSLASGLKEKALRSLNKPIEV